MWENDEAHEMMERSILTQKLMAYSRNTMRKGKDFRMAVAKKLLFLSNVHCQRTVTGSKMPFGVEYVVNQSWDLASGSAPL